MDKKHDQCKWCNVCCSNPILWGSFFVVLGVDWFARYYGILPQDFPIWPLILIVFGVYLIYSKYTTCGKCST